MIRTSIITYMLPLLLTCQYARTERQPERVVKTIRFTTSAVVAASSPEEKLKEVPVLCYHQVRDWTASDTKSSKAYITPIKTFSKQLRMLHDSGYHAITPDQLAEYLQRQFTLPDKPVLLTFDDGTVSQYHNALPELNKYGFKAAFFIMAVTFDRPGYLSRAQIKELSAMGHTIGCHSWDHHDVRSYSEADWTLQLTKPTKVLQQITGRPVKHFAYPFGAWNSKAIPFLKKGGYVSAFQLSGHKDQSEPSYTIRRIIVDGSWTPNRLYQAMADSFN